MALPLELLRELAREGRLTGTLQAREHDDGRCGLRELQAPLLAAEDLHQFLVDDLDDLLRGVQRLVDLVNEGAFRAPFAVNSLTTTSATSASSQCAADLAHGAVRRRQQ